MLESIHSPSDVKRLNSTQTRQLCDELRLLVGGRTVIRDDLYPLPRRDVLEVPAGTFSTAALDVRTFDDQPCHASLSNSRSFCSIRS